MISRYYIQILLLLFPEIFDLVIIHRAVQSPDSLFAKTFEALQQQTEFDGACDEKNAECVCVENLIFLSLCCCCQNAVEIVVSPRILATLGL
jgi:hypothetical protein